MYTAAIFRITIALCALYVLQRNTFQSLKWDSTSWGTQDQPESLQHSSGTLAYYNGKLVVVKKVKMHCPITLTKSRLVELKQVRVLRYALHSTAESYR